MCLSEPIGKTHRLAERVPDEVPVCQRLPIDGELDFQSTAKRVPQVLVSTVTLSLDDVHVSELSVL